jgi:hypothetical protein
MNENKLKHLELIQNVINQMAANSFLLKGWTVALVSSIFVLSQKDSNGAYVIVAVLPIIGFWILDSYFPKYRTKIVESPQTHLPSARS